MSAKKSIRFITLGCSKNTVDTEKMAAWFNPKLFNIDNSDSFKQSDFVVINTCGFINDAKEESINTIIEAIEQKRKGNIGKIIVWGCLSERYKKELIEEMPEVDFFAGIESFKQVKQFISKQPYTPETGTRIRNNAKHFAYLKISEGCNRTCSFCAIPLIKGELRSETKNKLINEAKKLAESGTKELILVAQDLTAYGSDTPKKNELVSLIQSLSTIKEIEWIRLHYAYPQNFPDELLFEMRDNPKVCKYLDIPFQHICSKILKSMRRGIDKENTYKLIEKIRKIIPEISLRTSLLVGYPNETEEEFQELLEFVQSVKFNRLGVFTYSHEENTIAHKELTDSISEEVKQNRAEKVMEIQQDISNELNALFVGKKVKVLIDSKSGNYFIGRTQFDSPEVDNEVLIKAKYLAIGEFYDVTITHYSDYEIYGKL